MASGVSAKMFQLNLHLESARITRDSVEVRRAFLSIQMASIRLRKPVDLLKRAMNAMSQAGKVMASGLKVAGKATMAVGRGLKGLGQMALGVTRRMGDLAGRGMASVIGGARRLAGAISNLATRAFVRMHEWAGRAGAGIRTLGRRILSLGQVSVRMKSVVSSFAGMIAGLASTALNVATAITSSIVNFVKQNAAKVVELAADAEGVARRFAWVFGDAAEALDKRLASLASQVGRSRFELRAMASEFGAMLSPLGMASDKTAEMSERLSMLAVDLASAFHVGEADALAALKSSLRGGTEALRDFGIVLSEEAIQLEALKLGLIGEKDSLTELARVQAIYSLIMQRTADVQGEATRTSGGFAGQLRRLRSSIRDIATEIGQYVLPKLTQLVKYLNQVVVPKVREWVKGFFEGGGSQKFAVFIGKAVNVARSFFLMIMSMLRAVGAAFNEVAKTVLNLFGVNLDDLLKNLNFSNFLEGAVDFFNLLRYFIDRLDLVIAIGIEKAKLFVTSLFEDVKYFFSTQLPSMLRNVFSRITTFFKTLWEWAIAVGWPFIKAVTSYVGASIARQLTTDGKQRNALDGQLSALSVEIMSYLARFGIMFKTSLPKPETVPARNRTGRESEMQAMIDAMTRSLFGGLSDWMKSHGNIAGTIAATLKDLFTFSGLAGLPDVIKHLFGNENTTRSAGTRELGRASFTPLIDGWKKVQEQIPLTGKTKRENANAHNLQRTASNTGGMLERLLRLIALGEQLGRNVDHLKKMAEKWQPGLAG